MPDRREEILWTKSHPTPTSVTINGAKDAMDEYMKECCLELLEYVGKHKVYSTMNGGKDTFFWFKGEWITKEQLFENFL